MIIHSIFGGISNVELSGVNCNINNTHKPCSNNSVPLMDVSISPDSSSTLHLISVILKLGEILKRRSLPLSPKLSTSALSDSGFSKSVSLMSHMADGQRHEHKKVALPPGNDT